MPGNPGQPGPPGPQGPPGPPGAPAVSPEANLWVNKTALTMTEPLEIRGSGFRVGEPVTIILQIDQFLQRVIGEATADASGAFLARFESIGGRPDTIARVRPGNVYSLTAQGADGSRASTPVMIVAAPVPEGAVGALWAGAVPPGPNGKLTLLVGGFKPNEFVVVTAVAASGGQDVILVGGEVNASGAATLEATTNLEEGIYTLKAIGDQGSQASAPLFVGTK